MLRACERARDAESRLSVLAVADFGTPLQSVGEPVSEI
jgi:hypothetical protein